MLNNQVEEETNNVSYKIYLYGTAEIRRLGFKKSLSFERISQELVQMFKERSHEAMKLMYQDEEGDYITVSSEREWKEAQNVLKSSAITRLYVSFGKASDSGSCSGSNANLNTNASLETGCRPCPGKLRKRGGGGGGCRVGERSLSTPMVPVGNNKKELKALKKLSDAALSEIPDGLKPGSLVYLKSKSSKKILRIDTEGKIDALGEKDKTTVFIVHKGVATPNSIRLQSQSNPKHWLRINKMGQLDGLGKGGALTEFVLTFCRLRKNKKGGEENASPKLIVCLRSANSNHGVGFFPDGTVKDPKIVGKGKNAKLIVQAISDNNNNSNNNSSSNDIILYDDNEGLFGEFKKQ